MDSPLIWEYVCNLISSTESQNDFSNISASFPKLKPLKSLNLFLAIFFFVEISLKRVILCQVGREILDKNFKIRGFQQKSELQVVPLTDM